MLVAAVPSIARDRLNATLCPLIRWTLAHLLCVVSSCSRFTLLCTPTHEYRNAGHQSSRKQRETAHWQSYCVAGERCKEIQMYTSPSTRTRRLISIFFIPASM